MVGALRTCGSGLRRFGRTPGPGLMAAALALAACTSSSAPPQPQTARVERTTVYTAVSSSGALSASSEQNLGFLRGGRLTAVNVQVGDRVTAGQVLATLDDGPARRTLEQQQAQLDAQRAVLARLVNSTAVPGAQNSVQQAQAILDATEDQVQATREADDSALNRAQKQLDFDEDAQDNAQDQLDADEQACGASTGTGDATTGTFTLPFSAASTNPTTSPTSPTSGSGTGTSTGTGTSDDVAAADDPDDAEYKTGHRTWHHRIGATSTGTGVVDGRDVDGHRHRRNGNREHGRTGHLLRPHRRPSTPSDPVPAAASPPTSPRSRRRTGRSSPAAPPGTRRGRSGTSTRPRARCRSRTRGRGSSARRTASTRPPPTGRRPSPSSRR